MCREANRKDILDACEELDCLEDGQEALMEEEIDDAVLEEFLIPRCSKCHGLGYMLAFKDEKCPACGGKGS